jgi:hypothetical protein
MPLKGPLLWAHVYKCLVEEDSRILSQQNTSIGWAHGYQEGWPFRERN